MVISIRKKQNMRDSIGFKNFSKIHRIFIHRISGLFLPLFVLIFLLYGGYKALQNTHTEALNTENRNPEQIPQLHSLSEFVGRDYQTQMENALPDQFPANQYVKKLYYGATNKALLKLFNHTFSFSDHYVSFRNKFYLYGKKDNLYIIANRHQFTPTKRKLLNEFASTVNQALKDNPQTNFYMYYVTLDRDIRFDNASKSGFWDYLSSRLELPPTHTDELHVSSFEDYQKYFMRTDHHWSYQGIYEAYTQLYNILGLESQGETQLKPIEKSPDPAQNPGKCQYERDGKTILVSKHYCDSRGRMTGSMDLFQEPFRAYRYQFPPMVITVEGEKVGFGDEESFFNGVRPEDQLRYREFYGYNNAETIFTTERDSRPNILVFGNSYFKPLLKMIASHYHQTYSIDLRYYKDVKKHEFNINEYIQEHQINEVLFIINILFIDDYHTIEL